MRVTNEIRDAFVHAVMASIPMKSSFNYDMACEEIKKRSDATLPKDVQNFIKKHGDLINRDSRSLRHIIGEYSDPKWHRVYLVRGQSCDNIPIDDLVEQHKTYIAEKNDRTSMMRKLKAMAASANTLKQLQELFPELVEFMPKEENATGKRLLPVVQAGGVVGELVKMGLKVKKVKK
jgi:hypothetical protein